jgi:choline dehydrogenase
LTSASASGGQAIADHSALSSFIAANVSTYYHPTSTAPMGGPADPQAVVDAVGAVKCVSGLRVVDASIIPEIPSTVTNLTVMMLAERIHQRVYG